MQTIAVNTQAELAALIPALMAQPLLALDTEFVRVDTFHPKLGLIQIGDRQHEYLIDPLLMSDLSVLAPLLLAEKPLKILHACSEDLEVLARLCGAMPRGVLDTQMAVAFLGQGLQMGYQKALQEFLGVDIPKDESRSDWLARPLSEAQITYAALDVRYLPQLYDKLEAQLKAGGLFDYFAADCAQMLADQVRALDVDLGTVYESVSNAWRLRPQELAVLKALTIWREHSARERDLPRGFLIKNGSLFTLARRQPQNLQQLGEVEDMTPRILRREGQTILNLIREARVLPAEAWPRRLPPPLPREARELFDALKKVAAQVAQDIGMPADVLLRKKHAEGLVMALVDEAGEAAVPAALKGWRAAVLTPKLMACLQGYADDLKAWGDMRRAAVNEVA